MGKLRVLDLFSGIGGFSLGLERAHLEGAYYNGFETVAFCEIEEFPRRVLAKHWPDVPCYRDVEFLVGRDDLTVGKVDVICGGFPCQPFSSASRGRRVARDLWPSMRDLIQWIRPTYVIAENVQEDAIRRAAIQCNAISVLGYRTCVRRISATDAGADHQRDRWWLVAYPDHQGELPGCVDAEVAMLPELCGGLWGPANYARAVRVPDGVPGRMDRLKALGNAVVPQIPEAIGNAVLRSLARTPSTPTPLSEDE